jgi:hypothetical protein
MSRKRNDDLKPQVSWPDLRKPSDSWTMAEMRAVAINPVVTGIGLHPRSVSDEDWVLSCEADVETNGLPQFLTDLLHVLRSTMPTYIGGPPPVGDYPRRQSDEGIPLPNVSYPGDRGWNEDGWTEEMVGGILCNPVYAGVPPFPAMIDDQTWIDAGVKLAEEMGLRQYLVNVLYELKKSVASVCTE